MFKGNLFNFIIIQYCSSGAAQEQLPTLNLIESFDCILSQDLQL